jgi:CheY-like chemotaxis protein
MKVMVVEDDPDILKLTKTMLAIDGYETIEAFTGEECLKKLTQGEVPDMFLLDVMMPGIDGYEVCRKIKSDDKLKKIPAIMYTVKVKDEDKERGFQAGANGYVEKPFDPYVFLKEIQALLKTDN